MDFSEALIKLKCGFFVARKGWNGKNMFLWVKPGAIINESWCKDSTLLLICQDNGGEVEGLPTICMKTADNKVVTGWVPTQADMFSEDWGVYVRDVKLDNEQKEPAWDIPEDEKVSAEDIESILHDTRFNTAVGDVTHKLEAMNDNPAPAIDVLAEFKKSFKMGDEYETAPKRTDLQNFKAEVQNVGTQVLRMATRDERLEYLKQAKEELLANADTDVKKAVLEDNFALFEDYINNN